MDFELLQWEPSLAPSLAESANDAKIDWWLGEDFPSPYTEEDAKKYIDSTFVMNRLEGNNFCAIVADDRAIGSISLMARGLGVRKFCAELGYWLNPAYWGKGIMTEAVRRICGKAFEETDVAAFRRRFLRRTRLPAACWKSAVSRSREHSERAPIKGESFLTAAFMRC